MEQAKASSNGRWAGRRGIGTAIAAVIMVVVIALVGVGTYVGLNAQSHGTTTKSHCYPPSSPACVASAVTHDVGLLVPFKAVQTGNPVPFTATLPAGESASKFMFNFGDGATASGAQPTASHVYTVAGSYVISVQAVVNGVTHDNYQKLVTVAVASTFSSSTAGNEPGVSGQIVTNSSVTAGTAATPILQPGGSVTFTGSYTTSPTNPLFALGNPSIVASTGGTISGTPTITSTSATATVQFASSGTYTVSFVGVATSGTVSAYQNYTWTVFVAPSGLHAGLSGGGSAVSPHKGLLNVYELTPGGATSEDPAVDYETAGYEVELNIYQTLVAYNGSQTGPTYSSYVPQLATCVPGSPLCVAQFGSNLIQGDNYTFVLDGAAKFLDPATKASWGVYPTDVLFSVARTMSFANLPSYGGNNGWILEQSLLPSGNKGWDSGIHSARNNTPDNIYSHVILNGTQCPSTAMTNPAYHGCVTFWANGAGHSWPFFLELIADNLGGSIVPCGWFSAAPQTAGIPYWTYGNVSGTGDHPCPLPGAAGYGVSAAAIASNPTAWDHYQAVGSAAPYWGNVQWAMAGSGPYYLANYQPGSSYQLQASPAYVAPTGCAGQPGCEPTPGQYAAKVSVVWETSQTPGEQAYSAGVADFASIPGTDTALMLSLIAQGKISAVTFPSLSIDFFPFNLLFNAPAAAKYTSNPITVQPDFFSYLAVRQLFARAYPYTTIQSTLNTIDGIEGAFGYGGAIPQFMANYYPTNVSWPNADPCTDTTNVACASYWWAQATTASSPYYDKELANCSPSNPCEVPLFGQTGAPTLDERMALWAASIGAVTGGAVKVDTLDINFVDAVINSLYSPPGGNAMPFYRLGWAPDYPDPTDYIQPLYIPDSTYTAADTVAEQLGVGVNNAFNASSCATSIGAYTNYVAWAKSAQSTGGIPNNCQGMAYSAMTYLEGIAAQAPAGPQRLLMYNWVEQIANALSLYTYSFQNNYIYTYGSWINGSTINSNVTIGGGGDVLWYTIGGNGVY
ncbi:MAG: ABC transporter substrate-binding protein [Thermoplasmata archaeon]|nr:ABC transporter substrate-binding protein [Thermoplasmata archaeon]